MEKSQKEIILEISGKEHLANRLIAKKELQIGRMYTNLWSE